MNRKKILAISLLTLACIPIVAFSMIKPLRIMTPTLFAELKCIDGKICTDDLSKAEEAQELYNEGAISVFEQNLNLPAKPP